MDLHQAATLTCNFELGDGKLYSVKWYKDENEFFRYMPDNNPQILTFPQNGVSLDVSTRLFFILYKKLSRLEYLYTRTHERRRITLIS